MDCHFVVNFIGLQSLEKRLNWFSIRLIFFVSFITTSGVGARLRFSRGGAAAEMNQVLRFPLITTRKWLQYTFPTPPVWQASKLVLSSFSNVSRFLLPLRHSYFEQKRNLSSSSFTVFQNFEWIIFSSD